MKLMDLKPVEVKVFHVFLASPGDVAAERQLVRQCFDRFNRTMGQTLKVRFEVVDCENHSTIGVGRPQELITQQTLERHKDSLALVVGLMAQKFGSPTGKAESGTEEEFNWAFERRRSESHPEIKWFFRRVDKFEAPSDPDEAQAALDQWKKVRAFKDRFRASDPPIYYKEYPDIPGFKDAFEEDLARWISAPDRPWMVSQASTAQTPSVGTSVPEPYYNRLVQQFQYLDIAGIDSDKAFRIQLSEIYVRLRVLFDAEADEETEASQSGPLEIQEALQRYRRLAIVGDPGSGKSTFLKYIALMLARTELESNPALAFQRLCLADPLPIPIFISCWDLSDFLRERKKDDVDTLVDFMHERVRADLWPIERAALEALLDRGGACLLFDGLDEVPTDAGRAVVSRLLEACVERFGANRYVVTSRVRAYTGETILKGGFTRCDIQPFTPEDRARFFTNWVALLFECPPESVSKHEQASAEAAGLTRSVEKSDRIRELAVNPLLLTVVAIVHWNRKRLPEQRVDLYDECVDVLLGQRKDAEKTRRAGAAAALDEKKEEEAYTNRAWVRKRFGEIAFHILSQKEGEDDSTRADVVRLIAPKFDESGRDSEGARARAEHFLEKQELKSGLIVSRGGGRCRFVHLTFQEYLAAWHLSKTDSFEEVAKAIEPHLREAKWFETLLLLGGEWARDSDERFDRYVAWLLDRQGTLVADQAPVVALCAGIVRDVAKAASLKPETQQAYDRGLKATLRAFEFYSGVPVETQLEILEALGRIGLPVKNHLIDATRASRLQVRERAVALILPHVTDVELLGLTHLYDDKSYLVIQSFLLACHARSVSLLVQAIDRNGGKWEEKFVDAITRLPRHYLSGGPSIPREPRDAIEEAINSDRVWFGGGGYGNFLFWYRETWRDSRADALLISMFIRRHGFTKELAFRALVSSWTEPNAQQRAEEAIKLALLDFAGAENETNVEIRGVTVLRDSLFYIASQAKNEVVCGVSLTAMIRAFPDEVTAKLALPFFMTEEPKSFGAFEAFAKLIRKYPWGIVALRTIAVRHGNASVRGEAFRSLLRECSRFGVTIIVDRELGQRGQVSEAAVRGAASSRRHKAVDVSKAVQELSDFCGWDILKGFAAGMYPPKPKAAIEPEATTPPGDPHEPETTPSPPQSLQ